MAMSAIDGPVTEETTIAKRLVLPQAPGRVRLGTLNALRWLAIVGQSAAVLIVDLGLGFQLPMIPCLIAIAISVAINVILLLRYPPSLRLTDTETTLYLAYDQLQLATLLYLTGGIENPFVLLFLAPLAVSASSLNLRNTIGLGMLSFALVTLLLFNHYPLPWRPGSTFVVPDLYVWGVWMAVVLGLGFTAIVTFRVATEATRMSAALTATQLALAREQKLSALGALAAATAHELGTPLGTIAVVAKELARELPPTGPHADDLKLLLTQVKRCRDILGQLAHHDEQGDDFAADVPLPALLDEIATPFRDFGVEIEVRAEGAGALAIPRRPEFMHGLTNLIENAADFARSRVVLTARWSGADVTIEIRDDGPGFAPEVINRLGEPYVTTRPGQDALREEDLGPTEPTEMHEGMGLGFFIAKNLLERTEAKIKARNAQQGGAVVTITWPRKALEEVRPNVIPAST
jgi:two-component system sensor histidine kinase RegB